MFSKVFFHGFNFESSKTFFSWSGSCACSNKLMSTWVQVTKTWTWWIINYYPPNRVLEWTNSHQCTSPRWHSWSHFQDERKTHPPCSKLLIFSHLFSTPKNFPTFTLPPSSLPPSHLILQSLHPLRTVIAQVGVGITGAKHKRAGIGAKQEQVQSKSRSSANSIKSARTWSSQAFKAGPMWDPERELKVSFRPYTFFSSLLQHSKEGSDNIVVVAFFSLWCCIATKKVMATLLLSPAFFLLQHNKESNNNNIAVTFFFLYSCNVAKKAKASNNVVVAFFFSIVKQQKGCRCLLFFGVAATAKKVTATMLPSPSCFYVVEAQQRRLLFFGVAATQQRRRQQQYYHRLLLLFICRAVKKATAAKLPSPCFSFSFVVTTQQRRHLLFFVMM